MTQPIKRVVVPLDAVSESGPAIDTAAHLAALWQVPLHAVFIEDEELFGLARLPFARQVALATGPEPLTQDHIQDHYRAFAERLRRELAATAARRGVEWSLQVIRTTLAAAALGSEDDFVVAGAVTRPIGAHFRVPSRWWPLTEIAASHLLLAKRHWDTGGSILTLLPGYGPESARTLDTAAQIAGICSTTLTVAGPAHVADDKDFAGWVSGLLKAHSLTLRTEPAATEPAALRQRIFELDCRMLVVGGRWDRAGNEELRKLVEHLACDVLIVR
jgi:hypothetical protein